MATFTPKRLKEHRLQPAPGHTWRSLAAGLTDPFAVATLHLLDSGELQAWKGDDGVVRYYPSQSSTLHHAGQCGARPAIPMADLPQRVPEDG